MLVKISKNHITCDSSDNNLAVAKENGGIVTLFVMSIFVLLIKTNISFCRRINVNHNFAKGLLRRFESSMWNDTRQLETKSPTCLYHRFHVKKKKIAFLLLEQKKTTLMMDPQKVIFHSLFFFSFAWIFWKTIWFWHDTTILTEIASYNVTSTFNF